MNKETYVSQVRKETEIYGKGQRMFEKPEVQCDKVQREKTSIKAHIL